MDNDGYWYDNPRELIYGIEIDDTVNKKIVRRIASLLIKLCPTGERTKDMWLNIHLQKNIMKLSDEKYVD
jgi:hypothetical protein